MLTILINRYLQRQEVFTRSGLLSLLTGVRLWPRLPSPKRQRKSELNSCDERLEFRLKSFYLFNVVKT